MMFVPLETDAYVYSDNDNPTTNTRRNLVVETDTSRWLRHVDHCSLLNTVYKQITVAFRFISQCTVYSSV